MRSVELHQAFLWTCDECGRDNFERAVTCDPENFDEDSLEQLAMILESGADGAVLVTAPDTVTCRFCRAEYEAIDGPCEDEEDSEGAG
jgi:hypothetical protein